MRRMARAGRVVEEERAADGTWIQTLPGVGWFAYFRIYGPDAPAFDGDWQLPDFQSA
jgi:hypothetical protein